MSLHAQHVIYLLLSIAALVCWVLAAFNLVKTERINLLALGLAFAIVPTVCIYFQTV